MMPPLVSKTIGRLAYTSSAGGYSTLYSLFAEVHGGEFFANSDTMFANPMVAAFKNTMDGLGLGKVATAVMFPMMVIRQGLDYGKAVYDLPPHSIVLDTDLCAQLFDWSDSVISPYSIR